MGQGFDSIHPAACELQREPDLQREVSVFYPPKTPTFSPPRCSGLCDIILEELSLYHIVNIHKMASF